MSRHFDAAALLDGTTSTSDTTNSNNNFSSSTDAVDSGTVAAALLNSTAKPQQQPQQQPQSDLTSILRLLETGVSQLKHHIDEQDTADNRQVAQLTQQLASLRDELSRERVMRRAAEHEIRSLREQLKKAQEEAELSSHQGPPALLMQRAASSGFLRASSSSGLSPARLLPCNSSTLYASEAAMMKLELDDARAEARSAKKVFINEDFVKAATAAQAGKAQSSDSDDDEAAKQRRLLRWKSVLVPAEGASNNDKFSNSLPLFRSSAKDGTWKLMPDSNRKDGGIRADQPTQNEGGVCWLVSVMSCLAHHRPELIKGLFISPELNEEGVVAVRLWRAGKWESYLLGAAFPTVGNGQHERFKFTASRDNLCLWPNFIEAALASRYGSYSSLSGGKASEAFADLTGVPTEDIDLRGADDDRKAEIFARLVSFSNENYCVIASTSLSKPNTVEIKNPHGYSFVRAVVCKRTQRKMVLLRDPAGVQLCSIDNDAPVEKVGVKPPDELENGFLWLTLEQLFEYFSLVTVAYTFKFAQRFVADGPRCLPRLGGLPENLTTGNSGCVCFTVLDVPEGEDEHGDGGLEVFVLVSQPQLRKTTATARHKKNSHYFDIMAVLFRVADLGGGAAAAGENDDEQQQQAAAAGADDLEATVTDAEAAAKPKSAPRLPEIIAVSNSDVDRAAWVRAKITKPGVYCATVISQAQHNAQTTKDVGITVLTTDSQRIIRTAPDDAAADAIQRIYPNIGRAWFDFMRNHPDVKSEIVDERIGKEVLMWQLQLNYLQVYALSSFDRRPFAFTFNTSESRNRASLGYSHPDDSHHYVKVTRNTAAIACLSVPAPWDGESAFSMAMSLSYGVSGGGGTLKDMDAGVSALLRPFKFRKGD